MDTSLEQKIKENASGPKSAESDDQKVEQHSISDQIEADRYLNSKAAVRKAGSGLKISKMSSSGGA